MQAMACQGRMHSMLCMHCVPSRLLVPSPGLLVGPPRCYRWAEYREAARGAAKRLKPTQVLAITSEWRLGDRSWNVDTTFPEVLLSMHTDPIPAEVCGWPTCSHDLHSSAQSRAGWHAYLSSVML